MSIPTMADHKRDAVRYPACNCGAVWKQRGNLTGHCTKCHQTFDGISTFDRHQTTDDHGRTHCKSPAEMHLKGGPLELVDGVWRGPRMDPETIRARFGDPATRTEPRPRTRQSDETAPDPELPAPDLSDASDAR